MSKKTEHRVGIVMNGVTGRMGTRQHLMRSIVAFIREGGIRLGENEVIMPDPVLVGRNPDKLKELAALAGIGKWTCDLDEALSDTSCTVYFDAQPTNLRVEGVTRAIRAGKHVYCEKPTAESSREALLLYRVAESAGVKHGVVQDKLWLPGLLKLKALIDEGFFGRILSVHGDFGYWVFDGEETPAQRPSWNYRKEDGGGIILDMVSHFRYVLEHLIGKVQAISCLGKTHLGTRRDEQGVPYACTAEDAAYVTFELEDDIVAHINASWVTRVRRDDLLVLQVNGTGGSAVAGLRECWVQSKANTPCAVWNPDEPAAVNYLEGWEKIGDDRVYENAFKAQWELFLRHVVKDESFPWDFLEGARGVQLAELALASWRDRRWMDIPEVREEV